MSEVVSAVDRQRSQIGRARASAIFACDLLLHRPKGSDVRIRNRVRGRLWRLRSTLPLLGATVGLTGLAWAADIETALALEEKANSESVQSQKRINRIDDQTESMAMEYRAVIDHIQSLRVYNAQLEKVVGTQLEELASLEEQIGNVTEIGREVMPLMMRMVDTLDQFVEADVPMLLEERRKRVNDLRELLVRADVENSEKYRRIMEAYQIENDYGRTIEVYQDTIDVDGEERTLDFLRIGRVALMYQTPDGSEVGTWDQEQGRWVALPDGYRDSIRKGIRIARKQAAPDMIRVPVSAPKESN
ncbi:MAG: hypothetical protein CBC48_06040 [bacterium TMED88]|nr:hypothetical protein [Deltaproteobacteria bacterium]OUV34431.1 MAG: hypothetical protein CBC48_06040 [bacterium TMED88]